GYQFTRGRIDASIYVGVDYQNFRDNSATLPPPAEVRGTEWGAKIAGDISTTEGSPFYANLSGVYSTAFDSYWARLRVGMNRDRITFGPEGIVMGNEGFDAQRLGAFITFHNLNPLRMRPFDLTLSGGHQFQNEDSSGFSGSGGGEGAYGAISFSM